MKDAIFPAQGIVVWRGKVARQPLSSNYIIQNRYLDGGVEQVIFDINSNQVNLPDITTSISLALWAN